MSVTMVCSTFMLLHHTPQEGSSDFQLGNDHSEACGLVMREITYAVTSL